MGFAVTSLADVNEKRIYCFIWVFFPCLIVIIPTVFPAPKVQAVSSSLTFFTQQRLLVKDFPNQLFKLNTEHDLVMGT